MNEEEKELREFTEAAFKSMVYDMYCYCVKCYINENNKYLPFVSVEDDLPCNHKELLHKNNNTKRVLVIDNGYPIVGEMYKMRNGSWGWLFSNKVTHWMPIPKLANHDDKY